MTGQATALRVVSLVPSLTESVLAFGIEPVACTRFCEQPTLRHVGGTKDPDIEAIVALAPDVVLVDREENRREDADALTNAGVPIHVTHVTTVADVAPMLAALRVRLGIEAGDGTTPVSATDEGSAPMQPARRAFVAIWRRPWMTISATTYGSSLLASVGISNVFADHEQSYPTITLDDVAARSPDLVLLPSEPYPFKPRHIDEIAAAIPDAEIRLIDGQDLFWWGTRTVGARRRLAQTLGPSSP